MRTVKYVHWQDNGAWFGYLVTFPDYWTQGETLDGLKGNLRDIYSDLSSGKVPGAREVGEMEVP